MRMPLQSVPYAITSEKVLDNSVELRHLSDGLKQQLQFQEDSKSGKGENNLANYVGGFRSVIAGGDENRTSANFSSILGGYVNNVSGTYGTVAGGQSNSVSGNWSFVGGGQNNRAMGLWSSVTAGRDNTIASSATYATIGGGITNQVGANNGTISGGSSNIVTAQGGTVSGGQSNRAMQTFATVSGGQNNIASGQGSVTVGGMNNKSTSQYSIVSGGSNNEANGNHAIVSGGMNNDVNAEFSSIAGGSENIIASNARASFISGGSNNKINSGMNSGIMGSNNTITSSNNSFTMGTGNSISNASNAMAIGTGNQVNGQNALAIGTGNITHGNNEITIGTYSSNSINPANVSNASFTGNRRFTLGIGSSSGQRENAITVFDHGHTLIQGKLMVTDTAFLNIASIQGNTSIDGSVNIAGNLTLGGILSTSGTFTSSNLSGTNTGDITIGTASGLSLTGQALSLAVATITDAGAMSSSDKTKLDGIATGAEVNVNADWNAVTGDAEILNKPTLGTMSAETASDYYTKTQSDAGFQVKDADLTTVATIGTSDQLIRVKNDGSSLEWFTPTYISSYTETDPQVGTIVSSGIPRWNGTALVTGSLSDDGTNISTNGTFTSSNLSGTNTGDITIGTASGLSLTGQALSLAVATITDAGAMSSSDKTKLDGISGTNTGDITIGTANGLSLSGQVLSLDTATITSNGAMTYHDKVKLNALSNHNSSGPFSPTNVTAEQRNALANVDAGMIAFCSDCGLQGELQYYSGTNWATFTGDPVASLNGFSKTQIGTDINAISQEDHVGQINSIDLSYDGSVLAVGFPSNGAVNTNGLVKVFKWSGSSWIQLGSNIIGEAAYDQFGAAVSISNNGRTLAIGAPQNDGGGSNAGSVRIYNWNDTTWTQEGTDIDGNCSNLNAGNNVELSGDGKTLAILSNNSTYKYFRKSSSTWSEISSKIGLGRSTSFSFDGRLVAVSDINHVNVYYDNGTDWNKKGGSHLDVRAETMANVSINHDGNIIAIGVPLNDANGNNAGKVKVMQWNGFDWIRKGSDILGESADDFLGFSVSLSSDGNKLIAGGPNNDGNGSDSGHARVFQWNGENWIQQNTDIDGEAAGDNCGSSVVISGDGTRVAIGATENDGGAVNGGHVRVFK
jgi:hypothetical protein